MDENDMLLLGSLLVVGMLALARICYDVLYDDGLG
ncbi:hypothetical protein ABIC42_000509 [Variovorax sp. 1133]